MDINHNAHATSQDSTNFYYVLSKCNGAIVEINLTRNTYSISGDNEFYDAFEEKTGRYSDFERRARSFMHPEDSVKAMSLTLDNLIYYFTNGNSSLNMELRMRDPQKQYHWFTFAFILIEEGGNDRKLVLLVNTIDKQKSFEQSLIDALNAAEYANKSKSEFLSRMSHDIRTPMNAIIGMTSIAKANIHDKKKTLECLDKVDVSSRYLLSLINDILDMSRIESGKMVIEHSAFDLFEFIEELKMIITPQSKAKNIKFEIKQKAILNRFINGDTLRLKQVLINLISNSIKFTNEKGRVSVEIEQRPLRDGWINMEFVISDNGIGMSPEVCENAFKPFVQGYNVTSTYGGSGLGLSICSNLVQMMNGTINVQSLVNKGTTFTVVVPIEIDASHERDKITSRMGNSDEGSVRLDGKRVLLAEDDFINAEIAVTILEDCGVQVDTASNGREAVEMFEQSSEGYYNAILMDIQMPEMNGFVATGNIRAMSRPDAKTIPIIAMTANAFIEDIATSKAHGMNSHLAKPIDVKMLYKTLQELID